MMVYEFTIAEVIENDDYVMGIAVCGTKNIFSKARGRKIATGRLFNYRNTGRGQARTSRYDWDRNLIHFDLIGSFYNSETKKILLDKFGLRR